MSENLDGLVKQAVTILRDKDITQISKLTYPWRSDPSPYKSFLAELLLVRTRADIVAKYFPGIFREIPTLCSLVDIDNKTLSELLKPLGLPKRVSIIKQAAIFIKREFGGHIPSDYQALVSIPGLGPYTAGAILTSAFGSKDVPADVNIFRFLSRLTGLPMGHPTRGSKLLSNYLPLLSPANDGPSISKLLDFSRVICRPRKPFCVICPINEICSYPNPQKESPEFKNGT